MANTIITKNSSTASAVPSAGSLTQGELAVNVTDKKLYTKDSGGSVVEITPTNATNATNATNVTGTSTSNIPTSALASGTANSGTYLRGDRTWGAISTTPPTDYQEIGTYAIAFYGVNTSSLQSSTTRHNLVLATSTYSGSSLRVGSRTSSWQASSGTDTATTLNGYVQLYSSNSGTAATFPTGNTTTLSGTWRPMGTQVWVTNYYNGCYYVNTWNMCFWVRVA